jgi:hypothetical protein
MFQRACTTFIALFAAFCLGQAAHAGPIFVSGDGNIIPTSTSTGNGIFFNNILNGGSTVAVLNNTLISTWSTSISSYYDSQSGISASVLSGTVTSTILSGVDLLVAVLPDDNFSGAEATAISNFLTGGGSLFLIGENGADIFDPARASINDLLGQLGSSMLLGAVTVPNSAAVIASDPYTTGVTAFSFSASSGVTFNGGSALISNTSGDSIIAYERVGVVPTPGTLLLAATGLIALGMRRRA